MFEQIINFIFAYILIFWMVLFCVLPIGVKRQDNPEAGNDHGAPANPRLWKKFFITAGIALFLTLLYTGLSAYGIIDWEKLGKQ